MMQILLLLVLIPTLLMGADIGPKIKEVVTVGTGMAGLGASLYLANSGIKVSIYEGRDRIGGRTHTHYFDTSKQVYVEEGGTTIFKTDETAQEFAHRLGVPLKAINLETRDIKVRFNGEIVEPPNVMAMLDSLYDKLAPLANEYQEKITHSGAVFVEKVDALPRDSAEKIASNTKNFDAATAALSEEENNAFSAYELEKRENSFHGAQYFDEKFAAISKKYEEKFESLEKKRVDKNAEIQRDFDERLTALKEENARNRSFFYIFGPEIKMANGTTLALNIVSHSKTIFRT